MKFWRLSVTLMLLLLLGVGCRWSMPAKIYGKVNLSAVPEKITTLSYRDGQDQTLVILDDGLETAITSFDGRFVFENVTPGKHTLRVSDTYYRSEEVQVTVTADVEVELDAQLEYWFPVYSVKTGDDGTATINGNGVFRIAHPAADTLEVEIAGLLTGALSMKSAGYFEVSIPLAEVQTDRSYQTQLRFLRAGQVLESRVRELAFQRLEAHPVEVAETGEVTFSWEGECGPYTQYKVSVESMDGTLTRSYTTTAQAYTAPADLPSGQYHWAVKALTYDATGKFQAYIITAGLDFTTGE